MTCNCYSTPFEHRILPFVSLIYGTSQNPDIGDFVLNITEPREEQPRTQLPEHVSVCNREFLKFLIVLATTNFTFLVEKFVTENINFFCLLMFIDHCIFAMMMVCVVVIYNPLIGTNIMIFACLRLTTVGSLIMILLVNFCSSIIALFGWILVLIFFLRKQILTKMTEFNDAFAELTC
jgi:hypothetical protein